MGGLRAAMVAALLGLGATTSFGQTTLGSDKAEPFITREWVWADGTSVTTFTAFGPPEQVNSLDPENGFVECQDCQLASSIQFRLEDEATLTEVAK